MINFIITLLLTFLKICAIESKSTAVWVDDGIGTTVKTVLSSGEANALKTYMLDVFGLPPPLKSKKHHHTTINGSAPTYLKSIFDALDERGQAPQLDPEHRETVGAADIIITFVNRSKRILCSSIVKILRMLSKKPIQNDHFIPLQILAFITF